MAHPLILELKELYRTRKEAAKACGIKIRTYHAWRQSESLNEHQEKVVRYAIAAAQSNNGNGDTR